jgi:ribonuclease E
VLCGERPPGLDDGEEQGAEQESVGGERDGVAPRDAALGQQDVPREGERPAESRDDAEAVKPSVGAAPDLDDQRQARERQREGDPEPWPNWAVDDEPHPERDEERGQVLDQQRDPDLEPVDRQEVEPLDEREPADPEDGEEGELAAGHPQDARPREGEHRHQADRRTRNPHLGEPKGREPGGERHLGDHAVDGEQGRTREHHRVAEPGALARLNQYGLARDLNREEREPSSLFGKLIVVGLPSET